MNTSSVNILVQGGCGVFSAAPAACGSSQARDGAHAIPVTMPSLTCCATRELLLQVFVWTHVFISLGYIPRSGFSG